MITLMCVAAAAHVLGAGGKSLVSQAMGGWSDLGRIARPLAGLAIFAATLMWGGQAHATCLGTDQIAAAVETGSTSSGPTTRDAGARMVAPVWVNGQGPFPFIVDTGANRTALAQQLARQLALTPTGVGEVHSVYGVAVAPIVEGIRLNFGDRVLVSREMPLIDGPVLAGVSGLLGVDNMFNQRLRMDFERRCIEIASASTTFRATGWTRVPGELRFGNLIVVPGRVRAHAVNVVIDTGSDSTLANLAFRRQLGNGVRGGPLSVMAARAYTMGEPVVLDSVITIPSLHVGGLETHGISAYVGDFHVFQLWGLADQPTLLIGMDVLQQMRAIVIDFSNGVVYFKLRPQVTTGSRIRGSSTGLAHTITR